MSAWTEHKVNADARVRPKVFRKGIAAAALLVVISSGCGGDDSTASTTLAVAPTLSTSTPTTSAPTSTTSAPTSSTSTSTTAPTSTIAESVTYVDQATYVSGTIENFNINQGTITDDGNGASHSRDGTVSYTMTANDPRAAGTLRATWNSDRWGVETNGALVQWGDAVLTNENGTWEGPYTGAFASDYRGDIVTRWLVGTGAYEGFTFYWWVPGYDGSIEGVQWYGLIYPGEPPPNAA